MCVQPVQGSRDVPEARVGAFRPQRTRPPVDTATRKRALTRSAFGGPSRDRTGGGGQKAVAAVTSRRVRRDIIKL